MGQNTDDAFDHLQQVMRPVLQLASRNYLSDIRFRLAADGVRWAVQTRDTAALFDWLMAMVSFQGVSDAVALDYDARHGGVTFEQIDRGLRSGPTCPLLRSFEAFSGCGYRKGTRTCAQPQHLAGCPLPKHRLRKGSLNIAAYALFLFMRDVCRGDFVGWIDRTFALADPGIGLPKRAALMRIALLEPLGRIHGTGPKLWSMMGAELLLGADPRRERWVTTGASMIAIDTLVHNFLVRTGALRRFGADHPYGDRCYRPGGCADIIEALSERIDARAYNRSFPRSFPRFVQSAIWSFCAGLGFDICNGNRIDDRFRCDQSQCPAFSACDRVCASTAILRLTFDES